MSAMIKVALTGNIGSGKSTVARIFSAFGVPVFNADSEARSLYFEDEVKEKLGSLFTEKILTKEGSVDTKKLASIIFNDKRALQSVNSLIHPLVLKKYNEWCDKHIDEVYTIHEAAVLFENNLQNKFDVVINVSAPSEIRIERVMERDDIAEKLVKDRIKNQMSDSVKCDMSDFVIYNDSKQFLIPQVKNIHDYIISS